MEYVAIAGALVAAYGAIQQGQTQKAIATFNAKVAEENAGASRAEAEMAAAQSERTKILRMGEIAANLGESGGTSEGNVLDIISDVARQSELEKQAIKYRGELAARGYGNTAGLDAFSGAQSQRASYYRAGSELLSGSAQAYSMKQRNQKPNAGFGTRTS